jgi:CheY-like chemotaxis protein
LLLTVSGYDVKLAHTGPEGVRAAEDWRPDVVICDIGLPGMDGFAVARHLRSEASTAEVRLLALTGYGQEEDVRNARAAGFDDLLVKPADPERLFDRLEAVAVGQAKANGAASASQ